MFRKSTNPTSTATKPVTAKPVTVSPKRSVPSVISADMNILGNIISEGIVDFDGRIDGNVKCASLVLRYNGQVNGEVHADHVQIYGKVKGLIKAKSVHLYSSCHVEGSIMHEVLSIEDGATVDGKFKRTNKVAPSAVNDDDFDYAEPVTANALENIRLIAG